MKIHFRLINGRKLEFDIDSDATIYDAKVELSRVLSNDVSKINLIFNSKYLEDNSTIKAENINESSSVLVHILEITKKNEKKKEEKSENETFDKSVQTLVEMGFPKDHCITVLKAVKGNVNEAAEYLLSGFNQQDFEEEDAFYDENNDKERENLCNSIKNHPELLPFYLNEFTKGNPAFAQFIEDDPASFLASLGLNPSDYDTANLQLKTNYDAITKDFSASDKEAVERLKELGVDLMTIVQVYDACEKNEESARKILESFAC